MQKIDAKKRKTFIKIIRLVIKDPENGLNKFYNEYGKLIYFTARSVGCSQLQAESVVNKVLVKIWQKASNLFTIENPEGWVYVVAKNCAKDEINEIWHLELNEKICEAQDSYQEVFSKDNFEYLISPLKEEEKSLIVLKVVNRCTFQEIADGLGKPLATVTSIYYRALGKIKKLLKDENFE